MTAASTRLKQVWNDRSISLCSEIRLMRSLVTSIFLCTCESWTLTVEPQRIIRAMEVRCYRKILRISYKDHVTNEEVCTPAGNRTTRRPSDHLKRCKLKVWTCLPFIRSGQNHLSWHSAKGKKTRQTEKEEGRQHHGMGRP